MKVSNRLYAFAVFMGIVVIILGGVWIYKQLKEFTTIPQRYSHQDEIGDKIDLVTTKNENTNSLNTNSVTSEKINEIIYSNEINATSLENGLNAIRNDKSIIY